MNPDQIKILEELISALSNQQYSKIIDRGWNGRLSLPEIQNAIESYGGLVCFPSDNWSNRVDLYQDLNSGNSTISGDFDLTIDGSISDLTLQFELLKRCDGWSIRIDDITVL